MMLQMLQMRTPMPDAAIATLKPDPCHTCLGTNQTNIVLPYIYRHCSIYQHSHPYQTKTETPATIGMHHMQPKYHSQCNRTIPYLPQLTLSTQLAVADCADCANCPTVHLAT